MASPRESRARRVAREAHAEHGHSIHDHAVAPASSTGDSNLEKEAADTSVVNGVPPSQYCGRSRNWSKAAVAARMAGQMQASKLELMREERLRKAGEKKRLAADNARASTIKTEGHGEIDMKQQQQQQQTSTTESNAAPVKTFSDRLFPVKVGGRRSRRTGSAESADGEPQVEVSERLYPVRADGRRVHRRSVEGEDSSEVSTELSLMAVGKLRNGDYTPRTAMRVTKRNLQRFKSQSTTHSPPPSPTSSGSQVDETGSASETVAATASPTPDGSQVLQTVAQLQQEREDIFEAAVAEIYELECKLKAYAEAVGSIEEARALVAQRKRSDIVNSSSDEEDVGPVDDVPMKRTQL